MGKHPEMPSQKAFLLKKQKGKCNYCRLNFKDGDLIEKDHIIPKSKGGKNEIKNLQLLHRHCHDKKTSTDGSLTSTNDNRHIGEKLDDGKLSRPVLKTSQGSDTLA